MTIFSEDVPEEYSGDGRRMSKWKSSKVKAITTMKSLTDPFGSLFGPDIKAKVGLYFHIKISYRQEITGFRNRFSK